MKEHFLQALAALRALIAEMASTVEQAVYLAVDAAGSCDADKAHRVIEGDKSVNRMENRIEEECLKILALYQPVAGDLRRVITVLKINNELERAGDLAVNIAERVADMRSFDPERIEEIDFRDMVNHACGMLKGSLDAMVYGDMVKAAEVIRRDDFVDDIHRNNYGRVADLIRVHPDDAGYYLDLLTISRCLERIADIATNISEDVIYLESGRIVRHVHEEE